MISFASDYVEGAHPEVLARLVETNMEQLTGYGTDIYTVRAKEKIKIACESPDADVYFLTGGTQTNQIAIATLLDACEGVVAAESGHINTHEAGAIEYTGHKVMALPSNNGKIYAKELNAFLAGFFADANNEHMIAPGMVYISYPTEYGTLYTRSELEDISRICREYKIPLYMDGARLGYGLMSDGADLTLSDIAKLCDVFYIGGTKVGALFGEAVVITNNELKPDFRYNIKINV